MLDRATDGAFWDCKGFGKVQSLQTYCTLPWQPQTMQAYWLLRDVHDDL